MALICRITIVASTLLLAAVASADPGLLAVYTDGQHAVHRIVPTPNFTLAAGESVHSQIAAKFDAVYTGVLKIKRGGQYTISGDAQIEIDGKNVADKTLDLAPGDHALKVTYDRKPGPARLQLRWKSDFFVEEPIPWSAIAHETAADAITKQWAQIEHGRALYEDLSCGACHGASDWNLSERMGPDLSNIGGRVTSQWLAAWLENPRHYRKSAVMPSLLSDAEEIRDVTAFLSGLFDSPASGETAVKNPQRIDAGKKIFDRVGCNKCHTETEHSLAGVGSKFQSSRALASFLANPLHVDPSGRMPQMFDPKTEAAEAELVAEFLFHTKKTEKEWPDFAGGDVAHGRELIQSRGCNSCHAVRDDGEALANELKSPAFTVQGARFRSSGGCLAAKPAQNTPNYQLSDEERNSLQVFLKSVTEQPVVASAPVETFYRRVKQFNCTACHSLNDQSAGPGREITDDGKIITIEQPPTLSGVGDKLRVSWIQKVLLEEKRTRPWMKMRMPHFGGQLEQLPELFPAASGSPPKDETPPPSFELAKAGLETIGVQRGQNACINCHNYRGINQQTEGVVPAPDMAEIGQTLRGEWFHRWLRDPSRMQPGTSMPQFFGELKVGQRDQKIDELWASLVHQDRLPLPKGLIETRTEGTRVVVGDDPVVFRVAIKITPQLQLDRAINVGLPGGKNFAFDARTARLRGVWMGDFINAAPAWNGRGGNPVTLLADSLFVPPDHFPLRVGDMATEPTVRFLGYYLVEKHPVFRYLVDGVEVHERIEVTDTHVVRQFTIVKTAKPLFFVDDKDQAYTSDSGKLRDGVLKVDAGTNIQVKVRRLLPLKQVEVKSMKWIAAGEAEPPKSKNGATASVTFENKSKRRVKVYWVGYGGEHKLYAQLDPGATHRQNTYVNNTWLIADEGDKPLGHFIVREQVSRAAIPK